MKSLKKKAQVQNIQEFVLAIVGIAVVLCVGLIILSSMLGSIDTPCASNYARTGTTAVCTNTTAACKNVSYTLNATNHLKCYFTANHSIAPTNSHSYIINTSTSSTTSSYDSLNKMLTNLSTVPTWIGILIIVALSFIVLSFFAGRK